MFGASADDFDIERVASADNLVFGVGEHRCIGAPMADQVVPVVLDGLLDSGSRLTLVPGQSEGKK